VSNFCTESFFFDQINAFTGDRELLIYVRLCSVNRLQVILDCVIFLTLLLFSFLYHEPLNVTLWGAFITTCFMLGHGLCTGTAFLYLSHLGEKFLASLQKKAPCYYY